MTEALLNGVRLIPQAIAEQPIDWSAATLPRSPLLAAIFGASRFDGVRALGQLASDTMPSPEIAFIWRRAIDDLLDAAGVAGKRGQPAKAPTRRARLLAWSERVGGSAPPIEACALLARVEARLINQPNGDPIDVQRAEEMAFKSIRPKYLELRRQLWPEAPKAAGGVRARSNAE